MALTPAQQIRHDEIRTVKVAIEDQFLQQDGVVGVGVAFKKTGGQKTDTLAIRFYVRQKQDVPPDQMLPTSVQGIPTDVIECDIKPTSNGTHPDKKRYDPLMGGISIGMSRSTESGTLGLMVRDTATGDDMMLGCFHTMCLKDGEQKVGDEICQEARADSSLFWCGDCGALARWKGGNVKINGHHYGTDAAVARRTARQATIGAIAEIGMVTGTADAEVGDFVMKRGRTSGLTTGTVEDIAASQKTDFGRGGGKVTLENQICIESGDGPFSVRGDSGSVVLHSGTKKVLGLLWGSDEDKVSIASPIAAVLAQLKVTIPGDDSD